MLILEVICCGFEDDRHVFLFSTHIYTKMH